jgi:hypothetical protein
MIAAVMSYTWTIDARRGRATVVGTGAPTMSETEAAVLHLARDPGFRPGYGVLLDVRDMSYIPSWADAQAYQRLFAGLRATYTGGLALVVSGTAPYGVARMMSVMFGFIGVQLGAFTELGEATAWLDRLAHAPLPGDAGSLA